MIRKLALLLVIAVSISACSKKIKGDGCPANQMCTMIFTTVGVQFADKDGNAVTVKDFSVTNLRTGKAVNAESITTPGSSPQHYAMATDANKKEFSTEGDEVKVTATNASTNKTVSVVFKISGGCNCHVAKVAGPEKIVFD